MKIKDFINEIGAPETRSVIGKNGSRVIFLTVIFFISLLVLGVANSSSELLKKKMQDPYIKFIDVEKPQIDKLNVKEFNIDNARDLINDSTLSLSPQFSKGTNKRFNIKIENIELKDGLPPLGMLLAQDDLFYKDIKSKTGANKKLLTKSTFSDVGVGLILTKELFEDFGFIDDSSWRKIAFVEIEIKNEYVKLPVAEVVEELRNNCKFAFSKNFLNCVSNYPEVFKVKHYKGTTTYFLPNEDSIPSGIDSSFSMIEVSQKLSTNCYKQGIMVESQDTSARINYEGAIKVNDVRKNDLENVDYFDVDYFTFHLKDLSKIEIFAERIKSDFDILIEKSKIEEKKNIEFFDFITALLYWALFLFTILSIILFIVNILISHLNSNKRSLGTLKAFGLSNNYIIGLYSGITLLLVGVSFIIAYISTEFIGPYALRYFNLKEGLAIDNFTYVNLEWRILVLLMVFIPSIIILARVFKYLHNVTPGDLIYERK
jgi:ABC-type antimicrobial peptide transport system permease subunit